MKIILPTWQYNTFINRARLSFWYACFHFTWCTYRGITLFRKWYYKYEQLQVAQGTCAIKFTLFWKSEQEHPTLASQMSCRFNNSTAGGSGGNERCECSWVPWVTDLNHLRDISIPSARGNDSFGKQTYSDFYRLQFSGLLLGEADLPQINSFKIQEVFRGARFCYRTTSCGMSLIFFHTCFLQHFLQ